MIIVMTGGTSGIGLAALRRLPAGTTVLLGARRAGSLPPDLAARVTELPLDLASLASVGRFADAVLAALAGRPIDTLLLNAGGQRPHVDARSAEGHELTFAANHLAHFLLLQRLAPHVADGGRVVITASGTHDPAERSGVPPPRHAHAAWLADPSRDPGLDGRPLVAGMRAYAASKLCNVITARLAAGDPRHVARGISVMAYDPGLTPGTGLPQAQHWAVRLLWPLLPLLVPFGRQMNHLSAAGAGLAALATTERPPHGAFYGRLRKGRLGWAEPSELARDPAVAAALWADSMRLCGLAEG